MRWLRLALGTAVSGALLKKPREDVQPNGHSLGNFSRVPALLLVREAREELPVRIEPSRHGELHSARPRRWRSVTAS
jgi:hypothetical protein